MPLMVFIGEKGRTRRSHEGRVRRMEKAGARGWPKTRIEAAKKEQTRSKARSEELSSYVFEIPFTIIGFHVEKPWLF